MSRRTVMRVLGCALVLFASPAAGQSIDGAAALVGGRTVYTVKAGDTLGSIGARFAVARATLVELNDLTTPDKLPGLGIHGTNAPTSIYRFASHGCIRLHPEDAASLFDRVAVGMAGVLVYQPVIVAAIGDRIWLEVHPDEYRLGGDAAAIVRDAADRAGLAAVIDWTLVDEVIRQRRGLAVDVTVPR